MEETLPTFRTNGYRGWRLFARQLAGGGYVATALDPALTGNAFAATGSQLSLALGTAKARVDRVCEAEAEQVIRAAAVHG